MRVADDSGGAGAFVRRPDGGTEAVADLVDDDRAAAPGRRRHARPTAALTTR
ncbi:hypothetical protein [Streptomyces sp. AD55]|uniref:hypothetical protein n=1 Tax=Streptomyces sp. AD55 TaxID=3242895 RepID=UPI003526CF6D